LNCTLLLVIAALPAISQVQSAAAPDAPVRFEVSSVKPSKPGAEAQDMRIAFNAGRFTAVNVTLKQLLAAVAGFSGQVQGGPGWADSERFDIVAKLDGDVPPGERNGMVLVLLEDRFKLVVHREVKEAPGLALAVGKKLPNLDSSKEGEVTAIRQGDHGQVVFESVTTWRLTNYLSQMFHTTVVDRTGIKGNFNFTLDPYSFAAEPSAQGAAARESYGDLVRTAVEQIGFKVESQKVTLNITVIDHAERPGEN
jgi:uncharacterized protein (TIGR03435 family)